MFPQFTRTLRWPSSSQWQQHPLSKPMLPAPENTAAFIKVKLHLQNLAPTEAADIRCKCRVCPRFCSDLSSEWILRHGDRQPPPHLPLEHIFTLPGLQHAAPTFHTPTHGVNDSRTNFRILKKGRHSEVLLIHRIPGIKLWRHFLLLLYIQFPVQLPMIRFGSTFCSFLSVWSHSKQLHGFKIN